MNEKIKSNEAAKKYEEMAKAIEMATKVIMKINEIETGTASLTTSLKHFKKP